MWHKPCRTFHPWCPCIKTRCLFTSLIWDGKYPKLCQRGVTSGVTYNFRSGWCHHITSHYMSQVHDMPRRDGRVVKVPDSGLRVTCNSATRGSNTSVATGHLRCRSNDSNATPRKQAPEFERDKKFKKIQGILTTGLRTRTKRLEQRTRNWREGRGEVFAKKRPQKQPDLETNPWGKIGHPGPPRKSGEIFPYYQLLTTATASKQQ